MDSEFKEWPDQDMYGRDDFCRIREHGDAIVMGCFGTYSEPTPLSGTSAHTEFTITTDTTEAPADALLEGAGYYVEPGDKISVGADFPFTVIGLHKADGTYIYDQRELLRNENWYPYSWDVKRENTLTRLVQAAMQDSLVNTVMRLGALVKQEHVPCSQCGDTGLVDGFLGVGIQIPCGLCGGK